MPLHFFFGNEDFLIEKEINKLKKEILQGNVNELNYRSVDNPSFSLFSELLRTNAMMFGDLVILIKCQKYFLETKGKITLDEKQTKELMSAFNNISDRVHIILLCPTPKGEDKKPDSRKKLYKELIKIAPPQEFKQFKSYEEGKIIPIIKKLAKELDIEIDNSNCSLLIQISGTSIRDLYNQLEKLKLYSYPNKTIETKTIKELALSTTDVFEIADLVIKKDYEKALSLISDVLQKEHYLPLLALLQTNFSNFLKLKIYSKTLNSFELMTKLKYRSDFIMKKILGKIKDVPEHELLRLKLNLTEAEFKLKTGEIKDPITAFSLAFLENRAGEV